MSHVDNMVVKAEYKHDGFEKGVQETLDSLSKLKESLKLEEAADELSQLGSRFQEIDTDKLNNALDTLTKRFSPLGEIASGALKKIGEQAVETGEKILKKIVSPLDKAKNFLSSNIVSGGKTRALNLEQAKFQMEGLLQSMGAEIEDAQQMAEELVKGPISQSVLDTAYSLDEAATVAAQLMASGITDAEELQQVLQGVAGVAAMTGSNYAEVGHVFTKIAGNGKVTANELDMLSNRGLNAAAAIAQAFGATEGEIRAMVHEGEISSDMFFSAMIKNYSAFSKEANRTYEGSLANVRAALAKIGAKVWEPITGELTHVWNALKGLINIANNGLSEDGGFIDTLTKAATGVLQWVTALINSEEATIIVTNLVNALTYGLKILIAAAEHIGAAFTDMFGGTQAVLDWFVGITKAISDFIQNAYLSNWFQETNDAAATAKKNTSGLYRFFVLIFKVIKTIGKVLTAIFKVASAIWGVIGPYVEYAANTILDIAGGLADVVSNLGQILTSEDPLGEIAGHFTGLSGAVDVAREKFEKFKEGFKDNQFVQAIGSWANSVKEKLFNFFGTDEEGRTFFDRVKAKFEEVTSKVSEFWDKLKQNENVRKLIETLKEAGAAIKAKFLDILTMAIAKIDEITGTDPDASFADKMVSYIGYVAGKIQSFIELLGKAKDKVKNFITSFTQNMNAQGIFFAVGQAFTDLANDVSAAIEKLKMTPAMQKIGEVFSDLGERIGKFIEKLKQGDWLAAILDFIFPVQEVFADDTVGEVAENLDKVSDSVENFGGVLSITKMKVKEFVEKVKAVFESIGSQVDFNKVFQGLYKAGILIIIGRIAGNIRKLGKILKSTRTMIDEFAKVPSSIRGAFNNLSGAFKELGGVFKAYKKEIRAKNLLMIAGAIGIMVVALWALVEITKSNNITAAVIALVAISAGIAAILWAYNQGGGVGNAIDKARVLETLADSIKTVGKKFAKTAGVGLMFAGMASAVLMIVAALKDLMQIRWQDAVGAALAIGLILGALGLAVVMINRFSKGNKMGVGTAASIFAMGKAIQMIVGVMKEMSNTKKINGRGFLYTIGLLGELMLGLAIITALNNGNKIKGVAFAALGMAAAMWVIAKACQEFSKITIFKLKDCLWFVGVIMAGFATVVGFASKKNAKIKGVALSMIAISGGIYIIAKACQQFSGIELKKMLDTLHFLEICLGFMAGIVAVVAIASGANSRRFAGAALLIAAIGAAISGIAYVMGVYFKKIPQESLGYAIDFIGIISVLLTAITGLVAISKGSYSSRFTAAALLIAAVGASIALIAASVKNLFNGFDTRAYAPMMDFLTIVMGLMTAMLGIVVLGKGGARALLAAGAGLGFMAVGVAVIVQSLTALYKSLPKEAYMYIIGLTATIMGIMTGMLVLAAALPTSTTFLAVGGGMAIMALGIALIIQSLTALYKNLPENAYMYIIGFTSALMGIMTGMQILASVLPTSAVFLAVGGGMALMSVGIAMIVASLTELYKNLPPEAYGWIIGFISALMGIMAAIELISAIPTVAAGMPMMALAMIAIAGALGSIMKAISDMMLVGMVAAPSFERVIGLLGYLGETMFNQTVGYFSGAQTLPALAYGFLQLAQGIIAVDQAAATFPAAIGNVIGSMRSLNREMGIETSTNLAWGVQQGLLVSSTSLRGSVINWVSNNIVSPILSILRIHSPSELMMWAVEMLASGTISGFNQTSGDMYSSASNWAGYIGGGLQDGSSNWPSMLMSGFTGDSEAGMNEAMAKIMSTTGVNLDELSSMFGNFNADFDYSNLLSGTDELQQAFSQFTDETGFKLEIPAGLDTSSFAEETDILNDLFANNDAVQVAGNLGGYTIQSVDLTPMKDATDQLRREMNERFSEINQLVYNQNNNIVALSDAMSKMQIVLNTGALVGQLSPMMNRNLGKYAAVNGRT